MNVWTENVNDCSGTGLGVGGGTYSTINPYLGKLH